VSDDSEEKSLPPSEHKLRKVREKGQVASSQDFVTAMGVTVAIVYMVFNWKAFVAMAASLYQASVFSIQDSEPLRGMAVFITLVLELGKVMTPLIAVLIIVGIAANIVHKQGIPFSLEPIKPDFKKINPGEGLKKLFARRNITEFAVSFVKLVLWFALSGLFMWLFLQPLLATLSCGTACAMDTALALGILLLVAAVILLVATGLLDLPLQTHLFRHEQRMGHKEMKRELKDLYGAPEFRGHRKHEHQKLVEPMGSTGGGGSGQIKDGTDGMTVILRGFNSAVGIYFHPEHCDVPRVVKRFVGNNLNRTLNDAEDNGIAVIHDAPLSGDIARSVEIGAFIRERHFEKVAKVLVQIGAIK
jgi:type III secretion protein U